MDLELWEAATAGSIIFFNQIKREDRAEYVIQVTPEYVTQVTPEGNSALHIASKMGYFDIVQFLCNQNKELLVLANNSGDYPLHCAARAGHLSIVAYINKYQTYMFEPQLIDIRLTNLVFAVNHLGNTALLEAVQNDQAPVVRELLSVAPATAGMPNRMGISPLYLAAERGSVDIVELLLHTGIASSEGPKGQNALHAAVVRSLEIAKLIVDHMPDLIKQVDAINKSTPLHYAASRADIKMVRLLLETSRSAAYLRDNDGFSVIHVAASIGHVNIIDELIRRCPDCMEVKDVSGRNFLHVAIEKKRVEVVRYVLQSKNLAELANLPDNNGNTALHLAVRSHNRYITGLLFKNAKVYTSPMNNSGDTPLDLASSKMGNEIGHRMDKIRRDLIANGSRFRPQRFDLLLEPPPRNQVEEMNRYRAIVNNLAIVAVLIATVTFAAVFTLPGGYRNDNGTSLRASDLSFKVFLISDTIAMVSSVVATFILINTGSLDYDIRLYSLNAAKKLIWVALAGMTLAFGTNVLVVVKYKWLAVLVCVISSSLFFAALLATQWPPSFYFLKTFPALLATQWPPAFYFLKTFPALLATQWPAFNFLKSPAFDFLKTFPAILATQWPAFDFLKTFKRRLNKRAFKYDNEIIQWMRHDYFPMFVTPTCSGEIFEISMFMTPADSPAVAHVPSMFDTSPDF